MKKWVKFGSFSYYSRALGKSDTFLLMLNKNRKLALTPKQCLDYYVLAINNQNDLKAKLQNICYWLEENKLVFEFGKATVENNIYKNERSIYVFFERWFRVQSNLVDKGTLQRCNSVVALFENFKRINNVTV